MEYRNILKNVASTDTWMNTTKVVQKKTDKNSKINLKNRG